MKQYEVTILLEDTDRRTITVSAESEYKAQLQVALAFRKAGYVSIVIEECEEVT